MDVEAVLRFVAENHHAVPERLFRGGDAAVELGVGQPEVAFRQRLPFADVILFVVGEQRNQHVSGAYPE